MISVVSPSFVNSEVCRREVEQFWRTLRAALATLPERLRTTFWLRDVVEWDTRALCEHLGVTEGHAHVLIHRARRQLRAHWPAPDTAPV